MKGMFPEDRSGAQGKTFETETLASPTLGLQSNVKSHNLEICRSLGKLVPTKITQRNVLSQVTSMFDPLGLFSFFTVKMRLVLKGSWKNYGQSWVEELSQEFEIFFKAWASKLNQMNEMAMKRMYSSENAEVVDLHVSPMPTWKPYDS